MLDEIKLVRGVFRAEGIVAVQLVRRKQAKADGYVIQIGGLW